MAIRRPGGLLEEALTHSIIGAFYLVHRTLGFGFMEHVYAPALALELRKRGHQVDRELSVAIWYDGVAIARQRLDMVVDGRVIVEVKATERLHPDALRQLRNYLRATSLDVGLLLHFGRSANFHRAVFDTSRGPASTQRAANSTDSADSTEGKER